uniref:Putative secreted protein n=1 Tax=Anopheles marajoara TaxID=58244 RepID=A0A2M4CBI6_9DIPT
MHFQLTVLPIFLYVRAIPLTVRLKFGRSDFCLNSVTRCAASTSWIVVPRVAVQRTCFSWEKTNNLIGAVTYFPSFIGPKR